MFPMIPIYPMIPNLMKLGISHDEPPTIYALLNSYVNYSKEVPVKIADLARTGRAMFFDFEYPLAQGINKADFETMILNKFLMRRIGFETVTAFKIALNVKLNEIMPLYNKLFLAIDNWNLFSDGEIVSRTSNEQSSSTNANNTSTTTNTTSDQRFSNTPQNEIQQIKDGKYVSEYSYNQDSGTGATASNTMGTNQNSQSETISRSPADKMLLYKEYLQNKQNLYTMIFRDLDELFYQLI